MPLKLRCPALVLSLWCMNCATFSNSVRTQKEQGACDPGGRGYRLQSTIHRNNAAEVAVVCEGQSAQAAGLREGMIITSVNGLSIIEKDTSGTLVLYGRSVRPVDLERYLSTTASIELVTADGVKVTVVSKVAHTADEPLRPEPSDTTRKYQWMIADRALDGPVVVINPLPLESMHAAARAESACGAEHVRRIQDEVKRVRAIEDVSLSHGYVSFSSVSAYELPQAPTLGVLLFRISDPRLRQIRLTFVSFEKLTASVAGNVKIIESPPLTGAFDAAEGFYASSLFITAVPVVGDVPIQVAMQGERCVFVLTTLEIN